MDFTPDTINQTLLTLVSNQTAFLRSFECLPPMWVFDKAPFEGMDEALKAEIIAEAEEEAKKTLYHDGSWYIDYVRIRFRAVKY